MRWPATSRAACGPRTSVATLAALLALAAWAACNGHLDFGARPVGGDGSSNGTSCAGDGDCPAFLAHCDLTGTRTCLACVGDAQCTTAGALRCDPVQHRCVACVVQADCALGQTCASGRCVTSCREDSTVSCPNGLSCLESVCAVCGDDTGNSCAAAAGTPYCLASWGACVACRSDLDCGGAQARCDPLSRACVQCVSSADCASPTPYCNPTTGACGAG